MEDDFLHNEEEDRSHLVEQFELLLQQDKSVFFDLDAYEYLIEHYRSKGQWAKALTTCNMALEQYPYQLELKSVLANLLLMNGKVAQALNLVEELIASQPDSEELHTLRLDAMAQLGNIDKAVELALLISNELKDPEFVLYNLALTLQFQGEYQQALRCYERMVQLDPKGFRAISNYAECLQLLGRNTEAIKQLEVYVDDNPLEAEGWHTLGAICNNAKEFDKAIEAFEYAITINHNSVEYYQNLGCAFMNHGMFEKALEAFEEASELEEPTCDLLVHVAAAHEKLGELDRALFLYRKVMKLEPSNEFACFGAGSILLAQDKAYDSITYLKRAIGLNGTMPDFWLTLARAEYKTGNEVSSLEAYEAAIALDSELADAWLEWSYIYYDQGDYSRAINLIVSGIDELPKEPLLYYYLTAYTIADGKWKQAMTYLEFALLLDFELHTVLFDFFSEAKSITALQTIIDKYRDTGEDGTTPSV